MGAIYWANGNTIGKANLDGSNANPRFISNEQSRDIAGACGVAVNSTHIFWGDREHGRIARARVDGTEPNFDFISGIAEPCGIAVNEKHVFWTSRGDEAIGRANIDGTEPQRDFVQLDEPPCGVALSSAYLYWGNARKSMLGRAGLDGSFAEPEFLAEEVGCGLAVDNAHLYWTDLGDSIGQAELDGASANSDFMTGLSRPCGITIFDARLYWVEQSIGNGTIGSARLDGSGAIRNLITGLQGGACGIAVDSLPAPPLPPPPPTQPAPLNSCVINSVARDVKKGYAYLYGTGPSHGSVRIKAKGLRWRDLSRKAPSFRSGSWPWRLKVWPAERGPVARRIKDGLARKGWFPVKVRIRCTEGSAAPITVVRQLTLRRTVPSR